MASGVHKSVQKTAAVEEHMLEDTDSEMLYQDAMDGFESDVELNMQLGLAPHENTGLVRTVPRRLRPALSALKPRTLQCPSPFRVRWRALKEWAAWTN